MNNENKKNIYRAIEEEIIKNENTINENDEKARMANANLWETKLFNTFAFSIFPYFVGMILLITFSGGLLSHLIVLASSLVIGSAMNYGLNRKYKVKERLQAFSNATTEVEKLLEQEKYEIEVGKGKSKNQVLMKVKQGIELKQSMIHTLSNQYDILEKTAPKTREEAQSLIEEYTKKLEKNYEELDVLSTQKHLHDKFWSMRDSIEMEIRLSMSGIMGGIMTMLLTLLPIAKFITTPSLIFAPLLIGIIGTVGYNIKRNKRHLQVFQQINETLNDNALSEKLTDSNEERKILELGLETKLEELSVLKANLEEQKQFLLSYKEEQAIETSQEKSNEKTLEKTFSNMIDNDITKEEKPLIKKKTLFQ